MAGLWPDLSPTEIICVYRKLTMIAHGLISRRRWRGEYGASAPLGMSAEDFAQRAVSKAVIGNCPHDPAKTHLQNLWPVLRGDISNHFHSCENNRVFLVSDETVRKISSNNDDPEAAVIKSQMISTFLFFVRTRDLPAMRLAEHILQGTTASLDLSVLLEVPVKEVDNIKKRLARLTLDFRNKHEQDMSKPEKIAINITSSGDA